MTELTISELMEQVKLVASADDGLAPITPAVMSVAGSLDEAVALADRTRRPVFVEHDRSPVTVFPIGTKPAAS